MSEPRVQREKNFRQTSTKDYMWEHAGQVCNQGEVVRRRKVTGDIRKAAGLNR